MKHRIIKAVKIGSIFFCGLILGAGLMNLLHMHVRPAYRDAIRIDFKQEQELLAEKANREGNKLRAVSHRWNVVDIEAQEGLGPFERTKIKILIHLSFSLFTCLLYKS